MRGVRFVELDASRRVTRHAVDQVNNNLTAQLLWCATHVELGEALDVAGGALSKEFMMLAPASKHPAVWTDINRMITLNSEQRRRDVELHVCPLQIEIVDRLIEQYSMPGELVLDPFAGIGTVPSRAVELGRRGAGVELNETYFRDAVGYCERAEAKVSTPTLFDLLAAEGAA